MIVEWNDRSICVMTGCQSVLSITGTHRFGEFVRGQCADCLGLADHGGQFYPTKGSGGYGESDC